MPQRFLSIKNYEKYQTSSGKKGNRPWIKLYKSILSDPEFMKLSTHSRFLYTGLLLLADDCNNLIYNDRTYIGQRLYIPHTEVNLTPLYRAGFLYASNLSRVLSEEIREEENRGEETKAESSPLQERAGIFWNAYPKKKGKGNVEKWFLKAQPSQDLLEQMLSTITLLKGSPEWTKERGQFIPYPATWLNAKGWEDETMEIVKRPRQVVL